MLKELRRYEAALEMACEAFDDLRKVNPNNPLLHLAEASFQDLKPTEAYIEKYMAPYLKNSTPMDAKASALFQFRRDIIEAIRHEVAARGLRRIVREYSNP